MKRGKLEVTREDESIVIVDVGEPIRLTDDEARWLMTAALPALLGWRRD